MVYVIMTTDVHGTPKFDSVHTDRDLANRRYLYLKNVCFDTDVKLLETKVATPAEHYVPAVRQILPVPHPRVHA